MSDEEQSEARYLPILLSKILCMDAILKKRDIKPRECTHAEQLRLRDCLSLKLETWKPVWDAYLLYLDAMEQYKVDKTLINTTNYSEYSVELMKKLFFIWWMSEHGIPLDDRSERGSLIEIKQLLEWTNRTCILNKKTVLELYNYIKGMDKVEY